MVKAVLFYSRGSEYRLLHHGPVHGNHYLVRGNVPRLGYKSLYLGNILKLGFHVTVKTLPRAA